MGTGGYTRRMEWAIAILVIAVLGGAAAVAAGGVGEMSREPVRDTYRQDLPDRPLTGADLEQLKFGVTIRGYAMDQVDDVLARLSSGIAERDALIRQLTTGDPVTDSKPVDEKVSR
jgi:DivIVA domain-containing protein